MDTSYLARLQIIEYEILEVVANICEKNGITYCLQGGTLLGAIRHNGFITWDDDIDITMPRKDFEKFIRVCAKELPKDYFLQSYKTDKNSYKPYAKVRKNGTLFIETTDYIIPGHQGIFIDIFPLDNTSSESGKNVFIKNKILCNVNNIMMIKAGLHKRSAIKMIIAKALPMFFLQRLQQFLMKLAGNEKDLYLASMGGTLDIVKQTFPKNTYFPPVKHKFEKGEFYIPFDSDYYLKRVYGDYMTLPPKEKRHTHNPYKIIFNDGGEEFNV